MKLNIYQIDAFSSKVFSGNPAAVCPLNKWLPDSKLQKIANENNLSETAFFVPTNKGFHIRWFTPTTEVDLCGHATLASAFVIFDLLNYSRNEIVFESKSGELFVYKSEKGITLNFPAQPPVECNVDKEILEAFEIEPEQTLKSEDYIFVFKHEKDIKKMNPDLSILKKLGSRGVIITAKSKKYDFVSRFFGPGVGIDEDPVTGSAHCELVPYWSQQLKKTEFSAKQISKRGGELHCELKGDRVYITGNAVKYLEGLIWV